jgi:hypothetical protein
MEIWDALLLPLTVSLVLLADTLRRIHDREDDERAL